MAVGIRAAGHGRPPLPRRRDRVPLALHGAELSQRRRPAGRGRGLAALGAQLPARSFAERPRASGAAPLSDVLRAPVILGASGLVGGAFWKTLGDRGVAVHGTYRTQPRPGLD